MLLYQEQHRSLLLFCSLLNNLNYSCICMAWYDATLWYLFIPPSCLPCLSVCQVRLVCDTEASVCSPRRGVSTGTETVVGTTFTLTCRNACTYCNCLKTCVVWWVWSSPSVSLTGCSVTMHSLTMHSLTLHSLTIHSLAIHSLYTHSLYTHSLYTIHSLTIHSFIIHSLIIH